MTKHEQKHLFDALRRLADRIAAEPSKAEAQARADAERGKKAFPALAHLYGERNHAFEVGWLAEALKGFGAELTGIIAAYDTRAVRAPGKRTTRRATKVAVVLLVALATTGCASDEAETEKLPTCAEIGAPDTLFCTAAGVCTWEGVECCAVPASGLVRADERCTDG